MTSEQLNHAAVLFFARTQDELTAHHVNRAMLYSTLRGMCKTRGAIPAGTILTAGVVVLVLHLAGVGFATIDLGEMFDSFVHWRTGEPHLVECAPVPHLPEPTP